MNKTELHSLIAAKENSLVEFKRDDCRPEELAKDMSALLNLTGGVVLLGLEDNGSISGLTKDIDKTKESVMDIARNGLQPATKPAWTAIPLNDECYVGIVKLVPNRASVPYRAWRDGTWATYVRWGSKSREATTEEEARLYRTAEFVRYPAQPIPGTSMKDLDMKRVDSYFRHILKRYAPDRDDTERWRQLLCNTEILIPSEPEDNASAGGLLLFGKNPYPHLPQAGVTAKSFSGSKKDYNTVDEELIRGPLVRLVTERGEMVETGVIDRTVEFVHRNMGSVAWLDGARRVKKTSYPTDAIREAIVNAVVHRDYARSDTEIEVSLYDDRLEIISPGKLPNRVTVEKMREGVVRVARNEMLKEILRDYGYTELRGMGVRVRIIESMQKHNGTDPDLEEHDDRFVVRLWKNK